MDNTVNCCKCGIPIVILGPNSEAFIQDTPGDNTTIHHVVCPTQQDE